MTLMLKTCIDCKETLDIRRFYRLRKGSTETESRCKCCENVKSTGTRFRRNQPERIEAVRRADGTIDLVRRAVQT